MRLYWIVLTGFLLIGVGFNFEIVAGNPMLVALGPAETASSRLNLGNALGAVAQIIAPASLSFVIPAAAVTVQSRIPWIQGLFGVLAALLFLFAGGVALIRNPTSNPDFLPATPAQKRSRSNRKLPRRVFVGLTAITLALGAEAALFGFYRNYMEEPSVAGLNPAQSRRLFTLYFALFAAGRLAGWWAQKRIRPWVHLSVNLLGAFLFVSAAIFAKGLLAVLLITAMGFWVATFYPTLYSLAVKGLGDSTAKASGVLTIGFLGAAIFPVLQGSVADTIGLQHSYVMISLAYLMVGVCAAGLRS
jgi:FHS family L-fucose permease-like MFS transporter